MRDKRKRLPNRCGFLLVLVSLLFSPIWLFAQETPPELSGEPGIIGTFLLAVLVLFIAAFIAILRGSAMITRYKEQKVLKNWDKLKQLMVNLNKEDLQYILSKRKSSNKMTLSDLEFPRIAASYREKVIYALVHFDHSYLDNIISTRIEKINFNLTNNELGSGIRVEDKKGLVVSQSRDISSPIFDEKQKSNFELIADPDLARVVMGYIATGVFWLLFGTLIGLLLGVKFVLPDLDHLPFLSFGRIRPVHTNTVFWGWSSMAMIGLGYFVVARTSNTKIFSTKLAWWALVLMNLAVFLGTVSLMSGVNNGGGEYREFIWPIMSIFAIGLVMTFYNFYKMIGNRTTKDIYVSNWYILGATIWTIVLITIGYLPFYQEGLGETIIQGYYMHQGVGMWFMTFTLGLTYYYLPSALNKPIYSYSLGILAFWTQMLFYTLIGTHHFVFSPIPWWLQTVAIVFSAGMFIPVFAGTTNFLLTMKGSMSQIGRSYILPFMLVGVVFYFIGSVQGSFQAFRFTNFVWHFTDFNVAHSHMTMYGIISFLLWGCIYALVPKLTGKEPNQLMVGMHFWLAFIGLIAYTFALMIGGTAKGLSWIAGEPFMESVILMVPYWLWRAIAGSFMFFAHIIFWFNMHMMYKRWKNVKLKTV